MDSREIDGNTNTNKITVFFFFFLLFNPASTAINHFLWHVHWSPLELHEKIQYIQRTTLKRTIQIRSWTHSILCILVSHIGKMTNSRTYSWKARLLSWYSHHISNTIRTIPCRTALVNNFMWNSTKLIHKLSLMLCKNYPKSVMKKINCFLNIASY